MKFIFPAVLPIVLFACSGHAPAPEARRSLIIKEPIPDRLVVLTFDDAIATHATVVLKKNRYRIIAMRDLVRYIDPRRADQLLSLPGRY